VTKETETTGTEGMAVDALDSTSTMLQSHILAGEEHYETTQS
jgi:F0F1-type ATP synthase beta subunit